MIEIDFGGSPVKTNYRNAGNASFQYLFRGLGGAVRGSEDLHTLELWRLHGNDASFPETDPPLKRCLPRLLPARNNFPCILTEYQVF